MQKNLLLLFSCLAFSFSLKAQNTFPASGNTGIGTITPATALQVIGVTRLGGTVNYAQFAADGDLSLTGTADFIVGANRYAFRYSANSNFGLYFNQTDGRYEFKNAIGNNAFHVTVAGRGYFSAGLSIGTTALPTGALLANGVIESAVGGFKFPDGTTQITASTNYWTSAGSNIYNNTGTNIGIGTSSPSHTLDVNGSIGFALDSAIYNNGEKFIWSDDSDHSTYIGKQCGSGFGSYNVGLGEGSLLQNSLGNYNIAVGYNALNGNGNGGKNVAIGWSALAANDNGNHNTAVGYFSMGSSMNTSYNCAFGETALLLNEGSNNCAMGYGTLWHNKGGGNSAFGLEALYSNDTASNNSAFGLVALYSNVSGYNNSAFGANALQNNTSGNSNTAVGCNALKSNTTGGWNTTVGNNSLLANTTGVDNCAFGFWSMEDNISGGANNAFGIWSLLLHKTGDNNCAFGTLSMVLDTAGGENAAFGSYSLYSSRSTYSNVAVGCSSAFHLETGFYNTALGYFSANQAVTSTRCTFVGFAADQSNGALRNNSTALGYAALISASNQVRIGNSSVTSIGGYVNWSNISDGRFKNNVKENVPGLEFINKLRPVTYTVDVNGLGKFMNEKNETTDDAKSKIIYTGFIAQEVEKSANEIGYDFSGVDKPQNDETPYGLRYSEFVVPLVKSVQQLSAENDSLKNQLSDLNERLEKLEQLTVVTPVNSGSGNNSSVHYVELNDSEPKLEQNIPNPFTQTTSIAYYIPASVSSAEIKFYSERGELLKTVSINEKGAGRIELSVHDLAAGNYTYSLFADGKLVGTMKMILVK